MEEQKEGQGDTLLLTNQETDHPSYSSQFLSNPRDSTPSISIHPPQDENQFLIDPTPTQTIIPTKRPSDFIQRSNIHKPHASKLSKQDSVEFQTCLLHKKPLDIFCLIQKVMICSSCALFGDHKGHEFKNSDEIQKEIVKRQQLILGIIDKQETMSKEKGSSLALGTLDKLLGQKREEMVSKLRARVNEIVEEVRGCERECVERIGKEMEKVRESYKGIWDRLETSRWVYGEWQQRALQYVEELLAISTIEDKVKVLKESSGNEPQIVKDGMGILSDMQGIIKEAEGKKSGCLSEIDITFDNTLQPRLKKFARVSIAADKQLNNMNIEGHNSNISLSSIENILDEQLIQESNPPNLRAETSLLSLQTSMRSRPRSPLYKSSLISPRRSRDLRNEVSVNSGRYKSPSHKPETAMEIARYRRNKLKINEKYDKIMQEIIADSTQTYDLTNGELGNDVIIQMLDLLKVNTRVRTLKLGKNKLSDDIIPYLWKNLSSIQTLNLSNNHFTEKLIDSFMSNLPQVPHLKSLVLTQNKIIPRALKTKVEQLRQIGILVTL